MSRKNKCKWCGAEGSKHAVSYRCGSWHDNDRKWSQGIACRDLCEQLRLQQEQTIELLRQRIDTAVNRAEQAMQFGITLGNGVACAFTTDVADVIEILRGNIPTNLEGS